MHTQNIILPWVFIVPGNEKLAAAWAANTWYQISYEKICISISPLLGTRDDMSAVENPRPSRETRRCEKEVVIGICLVDDPQFVFGT